ncbi:MAG: efflux system, outer rane lipoprotein NodT family [Ramlibacter sp.]|nr:efflux system, outer rane lipoprotein NodT family [Ramlibacter sp.]
MCRRVEALRRVHPSLFSFPGRAVIKTVLLAALVLGGCASAPTAPSPNIEVPATFREGDIRWTSAPPAEAQARGTWWKAFSDPTLDGLMDRAAANNTSIELAAARLMQARALARSAEADRLPQFGLRAGIARQGGPLINAAGGQGTLATLAGDLSYELDLFGRLSKASTAASLDAQSREALLRSTQLLVQADVAQNYLSLRALDAERELVRGTLTAYRETVDITERRFRAGSIAELDVVRVRAELASIESDALALDRRRAELEHSLAVLLGETASSFQLASGEWSATLPVIPAGVPSTVLTRRPDVAAAQRTLEASQARLGVARTAWFPTLSLTSSGGFASPNLGDLLTASMRAWSVGALLAMPLFDGGRREAGIQNAQGELGASLASYREQILVAFREVEDQLSGLRLLAEQANVQTQAVALGSRASVLAESRYRSGLASQLDLLDARRTDLRNRRTALQVRAAQYQATVALVRALGGGWEAPAIAFDGPRAQDTQAALR